MFRTTLAIGLTGLAALSALAAPGPASAQSVEIAISPTELSSEDGVRAVYSRIQRRARAACESMSSLHRLSDRNACRTELVGSIVAEIANPALSTHAGSVGTRMAARDRRVLIARQCAR